MLRATPSSHAFLTPTRTRTLFPHVPFQLLSPTTTLTNQQYRRHHHQTAPFSSASSPLQSKRHPSTPPSPSPSSTTTQQPTPRPPHLPHLTPTGEAHMVSITHKQPTTRSAVAVCTLHFSSPTTHASLTAATLRKGDALAVARVAGLQAAKATGTLIPLAHPSLAITFAGVDIEVIAPHAQAGTETGTTDARKVGAGGDGPGGTKRRDRDGGECYEHGGAKITARVDCEGKTGVEMEALVAAQVAGLALYDMLKGVDKAMWLGGSRVVRKTGGKSGGWRWDDALGRIVRDDEDENDQDKKQGKGKG